MKRLNASDRIRTLFPEIPSASAQSRNFLVFSSLTVVDTQLTAVSSRWFRRDTDNDFSRYPCKSPAICSVNIRIRHGSILVRLEWLLNFIVKQWGYKGAVLSRSCGRFDYRQQSWVSLTQIFVLWWLRWNIMGSCKLPVLRLQWNK